MKTVVAPAIANAIARAVGSRVRDLPITLEKVKAGMESQRNPFVEVAL
jgi:CO/xanthine dehydrogenase Mo-binding subunit